MKIRYTLILFVVLSFSFSAKAQSYAGGSIGISNNGDNTFKIEVDYVKNCRSCNYANPCNLPDSAVLTSAAGKFAVALSLESSYSTPITRCWSVPCTKCTNDSCPVDYGYTTYKLSAVVDLDKTIKTGVCAYTVAVEMGALDSTLSTIIVENKSVVMTATFDACNLNSTPKLSEIDGIICLGSDFTEAFEITDADKDNNGQAIDNYIFSLVEPQIKNGTMTYKSGGYSATKPLYYLSFPKGDLTFPRGFSLDSTTGQFLFRNMKLENSFLRVKIEEYRNNVLISTTFRDLHFDGKKCPQNERPSISGINCTSPQPENFKSEVVVGETICFNICTADKIDSIKLKWNKGIPNATFEIIDSNAQRQSARFCWTPTDKELSRFPYTFVVTATDNGCPALDSSKASYSIIVKDKPRFVATAKIDDCGKGSLIVNSTGDVQISQYLLSFAGKNLVHQGAKADTFYFSGITQGYHKYTLTAIGANGANNAITDSFLSNGNPPFNTDLVRYDICPNDSAFLIPQNYIQNGSSVTWLDNKNLAVKDTFFHPADDAKHYIVGQLGKCTDTLEIDINVLNFNEKVFAQNRSGDAPYRVKFNIENIHDANKIIVQFGDGVKRTYYLRHDTFSFFHIYKSVGTYDLEYTLFNNNNNCGNLPVLKNDFINIFPTSISEIDKKHISIFPNPNKGNFYINNSEKISYVKIYNINGQLLLNEPITDGHFQMKKAKPGLYRAELLLKRGEILQELFIVE